MVKRKCSAKQLAALKRGREKLARKRATTHRTSRRKTRLDYSKFSDRYMAPPLGIPVGNGLYRVVPPN